MSEQSKEQAYDSSESTLVKQGDKLAGKVIQVHRHSVRFRFSHGFDATVDRQELRHPAMQNKMRRLNIGDEIIVRIIEPPHGSRCAIVSLLDMPLDAIWDTAQEMLQNKEVLELDVVSHNKGGLIVEYFGLDAFVPRSQILPLDDGAQPPIHNEDLSHMIGQTLALKLIEADRHKNRLILSERAAGHAAQARRGGDALTAFQEGQIYRGQVTSLCDFGAFVDLGGINGLIHLSELSLDKVTHPSQVVREGDEVDVMVLRVDQKKLRIQLSLKALRPDPWDEVEIKYFVGQWVEGEVQSLADYGGFVWIEEGLVGLVHISEMSEETIEHPRQVLREKQRVMVRILSIDPQRRRLGLSLLPESREKLTENGSYLEEYDLFDPLWDNLAH